MATVDLLAHYQDLSRSGLPEAMCWAVIESLDGAITVEEVAVRLGGDPEDLEVLDLNEAYDLGSAGWVLHLDQVGAAVTVFESNGFQCARPEVLRALSANARVHSAYWSVNMDNSFSYASQGQLVTVMEAGWPTDGSATGPLDADLADLYGAMRKPGLVREGMLAAIERRTGIRLDHDWFRRPHEAIVIAR